MVVKSDSWTLLARIAAHGRRLQASEEVAHWTLRIIIETHMRSAGFSHEGLRELSAILGIEAMQGIVEGLLDGDAVRIISAVEPRNARRARGDASWARKRLSALMQKTDGAALL